jgi:hypothetical protein
VDKGDRVRHRLYGTGVVERVMSDGGLARVYFDSIGQVKAIGTAELSAIDSGETLPKASSQPPAKGGPGGPGSRPPSGSGASRLALECLRQGLPPVGKIEAWTVGLEDVRTKLGAAIDDASQHRRGSLVFVEGNYGCGKSHVAYWAKEIAVKRNLAIMHVELDGHGLSLASPGPLLARLLQSLELPDGRGQARLSHGLGVLLQAAAPGVKGAIPKDLSEFSFFLNRWEAWHTDDEAVELLEHFLSGELSKAQAQAAFRTLLGEPSLAVPALRLNYGSRIDRVQARGEQLRRLLRLAERCGARGALVLIDELDHEPAGSAHETEKVRAGLEMFTQLAKSGPIITMLLATPGMAHLKTAAQREIHLPPLERADLKILVQRTVDLYRTVYPTWSPGDGLDLFFNRLWALYHKDFDRLSWGPRFFVRATVEACELSAQQGEGLGDLQL